MTHFTWALCPQSPKSRVGKRDSKVSNHLSMKEHAPGPARPPERGLLTTRLAVPTTPCHHPSPTGNLPPTGSPKESDLENSVDQHGEQTLKYQDNGQNERREQDRRNKLGDQGGQRKGQRLAAGVGQGVGRLRQESEKAVQHGNGCGGRGGGPGGGTLLSTEAQRCPRARGIRTGKGFTVSTTGSRA